MKIKYHTISLPPTVQFSVQKKKFKKTKKKKKTQSLPSYTPQLFE